MHNYGAVLAVLGFVYRELAGAVVAELFAHAFAVHVREAVAQDAAWVPVAPDAVKFGLAVRTSLPKAFVRHFAAHAVGIETAAYAKGWIPVACRRVVV